MKSPTQHVDSTTTYGLNSQALATADAIADAQRAAVEQERARCAEIVEEWWGHYAFRGMKAGTAFRGAMAEILGKSNRMTPHPAHPAPEPK